MGLVMMTAIRTTRMTRMMVRMYDDDGDGQTMVMYMRMATI